MKIIKKIFAKTWVQKNFARLIAFLIRGLNHTYRFEIKGLSYIKQFTDKNQPVLIALWHGRSMVLPYFWMKNFPKKAGAAVFSDHKDGRLMQAICAQFGVKPIIGSSRHKGVMAARGIIEALRKGTTVAMTPDGPTGPRMRLTTDSLLFFAYKLNVPIIPFTPSSKKAKIIHAWDRYMIHRPYAKVKIKIGEPIWVKNPNDPEERDKIEKILVADLQSMDAENKIEKIDPQPRDLKKKSKL